MRTTGIGDTATGGSPHRCRQQARVSPLSGRNRVER